MPHSYAYHEYTNAPPALLASRVAQSTTSVDPTSARPSVSCRPRGLCLFLAQTGATVASDVARRVHAATPARTHTAGSLFGLGQSEVRHLRVAGREHSPTSWLTLPHITPCRRFSSYWGPWRDACAEEHTYILHRITRPDAGRAAGALLLPLSRPRTIVLSVASTRPRLPFFVCPTGKVRPPARVRGLYERSSGLSFRFCTFSSHQSHILTIFASPAWATPCANTNCQSPGLVANGETDSELTSL